MNPDILHEYQYSVYKKDQNGPSFFHEATVKTKGIESFDHILSKHLDTQVGKQSGRYIVSNDTTRALALFDVELKQTIKRVD